MLEQKNYLILFADDSASIRRLVEIVLKKAGYDVITADNGRAALDAAMANDIDALVTDISMPELSGLEVCQRLRETPGKSEIPLVILSGLVSDNQNEPSQYADLMLPKDGNFKQALIAALKRLLTGRSGLQIEKTA